MIAALLLAAVSIAFPNDGERLPATKKCYVIGATDGPETNLIVRGVSVPVYRTGAWTALVDVHPGTNVIEVGSCRRTVVVAESKPSSGKSSAKPKKYKKLPYAKDTPRKFVKGRRASEMVIALDPGHGGRNRGAVSPHSLCEEDANYRLASEVKAALERRGFKVVMTRDADHDLGLYERPKVAHAAKADAFVSIHHNAPGCGTDPSTCRYSAVYCWNAIGRRLALAIDRQMTKCQGSSLVSKGVINANFVVIRNPEIPSCLVEADFVTSPQGESAIWNPDRRQQIAESIAAGITDWSQISRGANLQIGFNEKNGAIVSLKGADGIERVLPSSELFQLSLLDSAGEEQRLSSNDFAFERKNDELIFTRPDGLKVVLTWRATATDICFRVRASGWDSKLRLNWLEAPSITVAESSRLYWPMYDGCEVIDYTLFDRGGWLENKPIGFAERGKIDLPLYPGVASMQFMASYAGGKGIYFAAEDARHIQKGVRWVHEAPGRVRLVYQTFCGDGQTDRWENGFDYVLRPYDGGWREACGFYRDWVRTLPEFKRGVKRPSWLRDSPVVITYPVRGEGLDHEPLDMEGNCYFPYVNALDELQRYREFFGSRILALLMHWEGTAPWAPPYVWPPYGGEQALAEFRDALHKRGDLLGLYCSGTAWTQVSMITPLYSRTKQYTEERLDRWMMRGPKGEIDAAVCCHPRAQRLGYDLCLTEKWSRDTVIAEIRKLAKFGVDYCQYFDQNLGGGPHVCWSRDHRHPAVPGAWMTEAMRSIHREADDGKLVLGCEGGAATPFVPNLYFNDSRFFFPVRFGRPVPGLAYVFHEWSVNFSGNGCGMKKSPIFRWTYSFHNGDLMTVVAADKGRIVPGWVTTWDKALPKEEADTLLNLIKGFNDLRRKYPQYLYDGHMTLPFVKVSVPEVEVPLNRTNYIFSYPKALSSFWQAPDGSRLGFLTNWQAEELEVGLTDKSGKSVTRRLKPYETITLNP